MLLRMVLKAIFWISLQGWIDMKEGNDKMKEEEINSQCDRCSEKYREQEGCPKEKGCGGIILLACRIQSAEYDNRKQEGK